MNTFLLNIASPDGKIFSGEVVSITLRGVEGDFAILAGHIPFVTNVTQHKCIIALPDGTIRNGRTEGGMLTVTREDVTFLTSGVTFDDE